MPRDLLLQMVLPMLPLLIVQIAGMVFALVAMSDPRRRPAATCLFLGLLGLAATQLARISFNVYIFQGAAFSDDQYRRWSAILGLIDVAIDTVSIILLIIAALGWRREHAQGHALVSHPPLASNHTMPPLSIGLRLFLMYAPLIVGAICSGISIALGQERRTEGAAFAFLGIGLLLSIIGMVVFAMTLHALWTTIQPPLRGVGLPGLARTTPAKAVGFLFIPLFNFYWVFQAWVGLAADTNKTLAARGITSHRVSTALAIAVCVCTLLSIIPFLGLIASLVNLILVPIFLVGALSAANALRTATSPPVPA